ncbi:MAG: sodium:alanine symporter family protein [Akkermansia sp.]|nr:sodium:alanine symporter family protein [Akkermansia sp.]
MLPAHDMIDAIDSFFSHTSSFLWGYILLFGLLGTHLYLTLILRFPQRYLFRAMGYYFRKGKPEDGQISHFSSLMISLAANVGTGNIVGVAVALATGGPGAVFWCMVTGVLGMATRYAESLLAIRYRVYAPNGELVGGPMYALERGLRCKWLAVLFAIFTAVAAFGIGNITQANAVARVLETSTLAVPTWATGAFLFVLVTMVLLGGLKGISRVCSACVPTMAIIYMIGCALLLITNAEFIWPAIKLICTSAFSEQAATGGFIGSTLMLAMQNGVRRGLFSNEAGMGSSPIVSAPVRTANAVQQALVSSTGPFWDTVVICTLTGITLTTVLYGTPSIASADGDLLTYHAFDTIGSVGSILLTISLATFVISTLLGWSYFGERALQYLGGARLITPYRVLWVVAVFVGCIIPKSSIVWNFADCANALMAIPNLICMIGLSGVLISQTRYYLWQNRLDDVDTTPIPTQDNSPQK